MEWSFDSGGGAVTVRQEGDRAVCQAIRPEGGGLYKAWLLGEGGKVLLGTLIPEGGALRLRRLIGVSQLRRQGVWPPTGAEIAPFQPAAPECLPAGWQWVRCPGRLLGDPVLRQTLRGVERALLRRDGEGFWLAFPCAPELPFPIPPLFCLSRVERLGEKRFFLFRFSSGGCPEALHNPSGPGEAIPGN